MRRVSFRYVLLTLASGLASLIAMGLPWSPMSCQVVPLAASWHPLVLAPWLSAALVSAMLLRVRLIENPRVSPWVAGALHALVSAMVFAFLFVGLERLFQGRVGFGIALQESVYSIAYGLLAVVLSSYIAVPVGMLFVRLVRAGAHHHASDQSQSW